MVLNLNAGNASAYTGAGGYCPAGSLDAGAVQTDYAIHFNPVSGTVGPPETGTVPGIAMSPAPQVALTESGTAFASGSASIRLTDASADLTTSPASASTTGGVAAFSGLIFNSTATDDTLTATLPLNPALTTPVSLTAESASFNVDDISSNVAITCGSVCGPNPGYGATLSYIAVVSPPIASDGTPTGSIAFSVDGGPAIAGTAAACPGGSPTDSLCAAFSTSTLSVTTHTIEAIFTATGVFESGNNSEMVTVVAAPTTIVTPPTASAVNSGQTLGSSVLSGGSVVSAITGVSVSGTWSFVNPLSTVLSATGSQPVVFTPSASNNGDYAAPSPTSVTVAVNQPAAPVANITPSSIAFGTSIYLGSVITKTVTVANVGNAAMTISNPFIALVKGGNSNEFVTVNLCPKSLAAGKSCTMTVTFIAGPFYTPQTATLMITDSAAGSPQSVPLSATVIDPVASFNPSSLNLGTEKTNSGSASKSITVTSAGGTALSISKVTISGADAGDFTETNNCIGTFNPKATCTISVTLKPKAKGRPTATLVVTDNAQQATQSIPLVGTGN